MRATVEGMPGGAQRAHGSPHRITLKETELQPPGSSCHHPALPRAQKETAGCGMSRSRRSYGVMLDLAVQISTFHHAIKARSSSHTNDRPLDRDK